MIAWYILLFGGGVAVGLALGIIIVGHAYHKKDDRKKDER